MSKNKTARLNVGVLIFGIILMVIGMLILGLVFNEMLSLIYWGPVLRADMLFDSANSAIEFTGAGFILFVFGLTLTEKGIIEHQKPRSS